VNELPRLAIFHRHDSAHPFELGAAASGLCRIVWVIGWLPDEQPVRLLSRFGDVVDLSSMSETESIEHLVALRPQGVVVFTDAPIRLAAAVAQRLDLPFHSPATALMLTDKLAQRTALREAGLAAPAFVPVHAKNFEVQVPFPAVLKPRAGAGGRDTFMVRNLDELTNAFIGCSPGEEFILEEWLPDRTTVPSLGADVVSVETVVQNGVFTHIMVTGRFPFAPPFRETGSFMPSDLSPPDWEEVTALAGAAVQALGITQGILHTEIKMTPSGPVIVEVNGRLGGGISGLYTRIGGQSLCELAMRMALGYDVGTLAVVDASSVAFFRIIVAPQSATRLEAVDGVKELIALPGIEEIRANVQPGDAVDYHHSSFLEYAFWLKGMVDSHTELFTLINRDIEATLHLTWDFE
jgi:biotin carboxylase